MIKYNWLDTMQITEEMFQSKKKKLPIVWMSTQDCTGCIESFTRAEEPAFLYSIFQFISLEYNELLSAASGFQIEHHKDAILEKHRGEYILVIEGSIPLHDEFLMVGGRSVKQAVIQAAKHAKAVVAFGSCSSWGGISAAKPNPTHAVPITEIISEDISLALVPGCPPIAEVMLGTLLHVYFHGKLPELDKKLRPKVFYHTTVHMNCHRKPFFDQKLYAESYDDENMKKGYCLFKLGCKGPTSFNACETIGWNNLPCSPIHAGFACIGCSEKGFWEKSFCGKKK